MVARIARVEAVICDSAVRGGRLSGWSQQACAAAARRYLDQTPPGWADFAGRNAELAARLR
jgi:excinuclease ABC subunit C